MSIENNRFEYRHHQLTTIWSDRLEREYAGAIESIAKNAHMANMAFSATAYVTVKDFTPWEQLTQEARDVGINTVKDAIKTPLQFGTFDEVAREAHDKWMDTLKKDGWSYGRGAKNTEAKTHPLIEPYDDLTAADKAKDAIMIAVVYSGVWALAERVLAMYRDRLSEVSDVPAHSKALNPL